MAYYPNASRIRLLIETENTEMKTTIQDRRDRRASAKAP